MHIFVPLAKDQNILHEKNISENQLHKSSVNIIGQYKRSLTRNSIPRLSSSPTGGQMVVTYLLHFPHRGHPGRCCLIQFCTMKKNKQSKKQTHKYIKLWSSEDPANHLLFCLLQEDYGWINADWTNVYNDFKWLFWRSLAPPSSLPRTLRRVRCCTCWILGPRFLAGEVSWPHAPAIAP